MKRSRVLEHKSHAGKGDESPLVPRWRKACEEIFQQRRHFLFGRPEGVRRNTQGLCKAEQFKIGNPAELCFDFGECLAAQVPARASAASGQHGLCQLLLTAQLADLRADDISRVAHVPKSEHQPRKSAQGKGSEFRTFFACQPMGFN